MTKPTTSWWVPVSSFVIAVLLAFMVGPKSSLYARPPGGATAGCTCKLSNLDVNSTVLGFDTTAVATFDLNAGVPSASNVTYIDTYANVVLSVTTATGPSTLEVDMKPKAKLIKLPAKAPALGVHFYAGTSFTMDIKDKDLSAAVRGAIAKKTITGEAPGSRAPLVMHVNLHAETKELTLATPAICKDDITLTFSTAVTLLGDGTGHGNAP